MAAYTGSDADITQLAQEFTLDPVNQGYAPAFGTGDTRELQELVNGPSATGAQKSTADFNGFDYVDAITTTNGTADMERAEALGYDDSSNDNTGNPNPDDDHISAETRIGTAGSPELALAEQNALQGMRDTALTNIRFFSDFRENVISTRYQTALLRPWNNLNAGNDIRQRLIQLAQGPRSRAEELWEDGTTIPQRDVDRAYNEAVGG